MATDERVPTPVRGQREVAVAKTRGQLSLVHSVEPSEHSFFSITCDSRGPHREACHQREIGGKASKANLDDEGWVVA